MRKIIFVCALLLPIPLVLAAISVGGACVDAGSAAGVDLRLEATESDTEIPVYAELQGVTLGAALGVDITTTGTYDEPGDLTPGTILSGTVVNSYIAHFDREDDTNPALTTLDGSVTSDTPILGVIVLSSSLAASDDAVRETGTLYEHDAPVSGWEDYRGLELNGAGPVQDEVTLVDSYTVSFHLETGQAMDEIRIITEVPVASIEKDMVDEAELGDHITITLDVDNPYEEAITVEDVLPDGLAYIPDIDDGLEGNQNLQVDGEYVTPTIEDNTISVEVDPGDDREITFVVQVVEVECEEIDVINVANVYDPEDDIDNSDEVEITLYPYEGFSKAIATSTESDPYNVPMYTDVHWLLRIEIENIAGDDIITMEDVVVKDNLGGDLEMHLCYSDCDYEGKQLIQPPSPAPDVKETGKTKKLHLSWDLDDLSDEALTQLYLEISTDVNPGQGKKVEGKNEYTSEGEHDLNSGATLKFTDPDTGLQLSAHTCPITVTAYDPELVLP